MVSGCETPLAAGRCHCQAHLDSMLAFSLAQRAGRVKAKLCIDCGKNPQWWTQRCVLCRIAKPGSLPPPALKALRQYRRFESIDERRAQATEIVNHIADARVRLILTMRHGLDDGEDRTLEEIGARLGVTRERVRQIEKKVLDRLALDFDVAPLRTPFPQMQRKSPVHRRHLVTEEQRIKSAAHALVAQALKDGRLARKPCEICGDANSVAHHEDYSKPLEVVWVCRKHHMAAHGRGKGVSLPATKRYRSANDLIREQSWWLRKVTPCNDLYDAQSIVEALQVANIKVRELTKATGVRYSILRDIVNGRDVAVSLLLAVQKYIASLHQEGSANN